MGVPLQDPAPLGEAAGLAAVRACLESRWAELLANARLYVTRARLAHGPEIDTIALEIAQQTVVEALACAASFDPSRQPMPWLLGIASKLVQRRKTAQARHERIAPTRSLDEAVEAGTSEPPDPIDALLAIESAERVEGLLAPLNPDQQVVIRLAVLHDLDGKQIALALGISPGAARTRLHRALTALRETLPSTTRDGRHDER